MSGNISDCHNLKGSDTGVQWVEARDSAKHLQCIAQSSIVKNYQAPNVNGAEIDKFCLKISSMPSTRPMFFLAAETWM